MFHLALFMKNVDMLEIIFSDYGICYIVYILFGTVLKMVHIYLGKTCSSLV